jgi:predicted dehydrogenase
MLKAAVIGTGFIGSVHAKNIARHPGVQLVAVSDVNKGRQILRDGLHPGWFERIEQSYYDAIDAFVTSVEKGTPPSPSLEDGLKAQLIADKATESLKTGQPMKMTR